MIVKHARQGSSATAFAAETKSQDGRAVSNRWKGDHGCPH